MKGYKMPPRTEAHRRNLSLVIFGKRHTEEARRKMSLSRLGQKFSEERRRNLSLALIGKHTGNPVGFVVPKATRIKISNTLKARLKDKKHSTWQGGPPRSEKRKIRDSIEIRLWKEAVFARDNWTCQHCNVRGIKLHAHHIKGFSKYPELRTEIDNGTTLCRACHIKIHSKASESSISASVHHSANGANGELNV